MIRLSINGMPKYFLMEVKVDDNPSLCQSFFGLIEGRFRFC